MRKNKTYFNWSSGKDSALALYYLMQNKKYSVEYLLSSVNAAYKRVSMHGVRIELLQQQINSIGLPYGTVELPEHTTNDIYETCMSEKVSQLKAAGFEYAAFGDIFLEDLRQYREQQLEKLHVKTIFPLWKKNTKQLIHEFISLGFKAVVVCVNASLLDKSFAGRIIDKDFVESLPDQVDPCGENGEFHTFCFDGPIFKQAIPITQGEIVYKEYENNGIRNGFWFSDIVLN